MVDAPPDPFCGWGYDPVHFDPCMDPPGTLNPLILNLPGTYTYDTSNNGTLLSPAGDPVTHEAPMGDFDLYLRLSDPDPQRDTVVSGSDLQIATATFLFSEMLSNRSKGNFISRISYKTSFFLLLSS